jgi:hypothetical protein
LSRWFAPQPIALSLEDDVGEKQDQYVEADEKIMLWSNASWSGSSPPDSGHCAPRFVLPLMARLENEKDWK